MPIIDHRNQHPGEGVYRDLPGGQVTPLTIEKIKKAFNAITKNSSKNKKEACPMSIANPLTEAIAMLRTRIMNDKDIYKGFVSSIESALNEAKPYMKEHDLAKAVLDRIVGIERREPES